MKKVLGVTVLIVFVVTLALASKPPRNRTTTGSIAAIDASSRSFTIHPSRGSDLTLKVNDKTLFSRKGQKASWADLKLAPQERQLIDRSGATIGP